MICVHHLENSRSQRVLWLLEELGLDYEIIHYARDPKTSLAPAELKQVHPLGKSPVITDGESTIAETGAIIEYITGHYGEGRLVPSADSPERLDYTYWLHMAEGSLMPLLVMKLVFSRLSAPPVPFFVRPIGRAFEKEVGKAYINPGLDAQLGYIQQTLDRQAWFAGTAFSAADIQMSFPLEAAATRADMEQYPAIRRFLDTIHARPAYQRALEKGGPYDLSR